MEGLKVMVANVVAGGFCKLDEIASLLVLVDCL